LVYKLTSAGLIDWGDGLPNDTVLPNCGNIPGYIGNNAVCWQELSHTYYQSGQYTICMTGLNSCGDSTTVASSFSFSYKFEF